MKSNNKEALDVIIDIERSVPVDLIRIKDIEIWPLIRLEIWKQLINSKRKSATSEIIRSSQKYTIKYLFSKISIVLAYIRYVFCKKKYKRKDVVFLSSPNSKWEKVDGRYFRPFSNSLQDILKEAKVESIILDISPKVQSPVHGETDFILEEIENTCSIYRMRTFFLNILNLNKKTDEIYGWDVLAKFIESKYPNLSLNRRSIIERANKIFFCEQIFKKFLMKIKPKVCFLVCFYNPISMGYVKACRGLGIKTVEIQHSQQDLNGMYASWTKLPQKGYSLLPSYWWCWGTKSANFINDWSKNVYPEHQAIVGGNPWVAKNVSGDYKIDYAYTDKFSNMLKNKINVLVALQPIEPILSINLMKAISNSPQNINWLIRLHPAIYSQEREIKNQLKNTSNKNIEIEYSTEIPLFNLLKRVDFLITSWSGVAFEALLFGVHPIIIHPNGENMFVEYINKNLFTYADSSEKIIETIKLDKKTFNFKEETPYMETDKEKMKKVLFGLTRGML